MLEGTLYDNNNIPPKSLFDALISLLYPYLTSAGKTDLDDYISDNITNES